MNFIVAKTFKDTFESCQADLPDLDSSSTSIADDLEKLSVTDKPTSNGSPAKNEPDDKASSPSKNCDLQDKRKQESEPSPSKDGDSVSAVDQTDHEQPVKNDP